MSSNEISQYIYVISNQTSNRCKENRDEVYRNYLNDKIPFMAYYQYEDYIEHYFFGFDNELHYGTYAHDKYLPEEVIHKWLDEQKTLHNMYLLSKE